MSLFFFFTSVKKRKTTVG